TDAERVYERERRRMLRVEKAPLDRREHRRRFHQAAPRANDTDRGPVGDQRRRIFGGDELVVHAAMSKIDAPFFNALRATTVRWISDVPSKMRKMRASR